jgi:hypothetical protein
MSGPYYSPIRRNRLLIIDDRGYIRFLSVLTFISNKSDGQQAAEIVRRGDVMPVFCPSEERPRHVDLYPWPGTADGKRDGKHEKVV